MLAFWWRHIKTFPIDRLAIVCSFPLCNLEAVDGSSSSNCLTEIQKHWPGLLSWTWQSPLKNNIGRTQGLLILLKINFSLLMQPLLVEDGADFITWGMRERQTVFALQILYTNSHCCVCIDIGWQNFPFYAPHVGLWKSICAPVCGWTSIYCYPLNVHSSQLKIAKANSVSRAFPRVSRDLRTLWRRYKRKRHSAVELGPISSDRGKQSAPPSVPLKHPHRPLYLVLTSTLFFSLPRACAAATEEPLFFLFFCYIFSFRLSTLHFSFLRDVLGPSGSKETQLLWLRHVFSLPLYRLRPRRRWPSAKCERGPPWQKFEASLCLLSSHEDWIVSVRRCAHTSACHGFTPSALLFFYFSSSPRLTTSAGECFPVWVRRFCMWARVQGRVTLKHHRW